MGPLCPASDPTPASRVTERCRWISVSPLDLRFQTWSIGLWTLDYVLIYLDHHAATPVRPEVFEAMRAYFCEEWGNPSSAYKFGSKLKGVIEAARARVAELVGAQPREIIFTSYATESNNAAIQAALKANPGKRHIVASAVEHSSVPNYCMALKKDGYRATYLPADRDVLLKLVGLGNKVTDEFAHGPQVPYSERDRGAAHALE
jgi:selenocysteine lyase/cysteine desulfurase